MCKLGLEIWSAGNERVRNGVTHACVGADGPGVCRGEVARFDGVLDNSITDYRGREARIDVTRVGEIDAPTAKQNRVPSKESDGREAGIFDSRKTHFSLT